LLKLHLLLRDKPIWCLKGYANTGLVIDSLRSKQRLMERRNNLEIELSLLEGYLLI
jgi:hypothetical protein